MIKSLKTLSIIVVMCSFTFVNAARETYSSRISGLTGISQGTIFHAEEGSYQYMISNNPSWQSEFTNQSVKTYIELGWDEALTQSNITPYNYTINLKVSGLDLNGNNTSLGIKTLTIVYDPGQLNNKNIAIEGIDGYHKLKIRVQSIYDNIGGVNVSTGTENMYIEARFVVERYYNFLETSQHISGAVNDVITSNNELEINWPYLSGAENYELEWTYVNNYKTNFYLSGQTYSPNAISFNNRDFELNNTRVSTGFNKYIIPLVYDRGFILYRVRGVGRDMNDPDHVIYGQWSKFNINSSKVADFDFYKINNAHDPDKNWQYVANYAEEGKKKEVVSYFDGSLRNRQTVTRTNTNYKTIVGETIYDHQGRGAIQLLPVPIASSELKYFGGLNNNLNTDPYTRLDFDKDAANCVASTDPMDVSSGSSNYYSIQPSSSGTYQDLVPKAGGYPFTQTEYLPDNTGRIRRQSGVGEHHQLDSEHETRYFYGKPHQEELDRLFSYNVGYKSRYKKNMVVDPNGQVSVTYIDPQGRTIATALTGNKPANLEMVADEFGAPITFVGPTPTLTIDILNKLNVLDVNTSQDDNILYNTGSLGPSNDGLIASQLENNPITNTIYSINYDFTAPIFSDENVCFATNYPIVYDLELSMKDQCAEDQLILIATPPNLPASVNEIIGLPNGALGSYSQSFETGNLPIGTYAISKKLSVNKAALDVYTAQYILAGQTSSPQCIDTEQDYIDDYTLSSTDPCEVTCYSCLEDLVKELGIAGYVLSSPLPTLDEWTTIWEVDADMDPYPTPSYSIIQQAIIDRGFTQELWELAYKECTEDCIELSPCEVSYQMMLADASPGGIYFGDLANWRAPEGGNYLNLDGTDATVVVVETAPSSGVYIPEFIGGTQMAPNGDLFIYPHQLHSEDDFINEFEAHWAEKIVYLHPEYCYYLNCIGLGEDQSNGTSAYESSNDFDSKILAIQFYSNATLPPPPPPATTWNPFPVTSLAQYNIDFNNTNTANLTYLDFEDPYFQYQGNLTTIQWNYAKDRMDMALQDYQGQGLSMWELADLTVSPCGRWYGNDPCSFMFNLNSNSLELNDIWNQFKGFYLSEKQKIQADVADILAQESTPNCYNESIPLENRRFANLKEGNTASSLNEIENDTDYEAWLMTGQCPNAFDVQLLLNGLAENDELTTTTMPMLNVRAFTPSLYQVISELDYLNQPSADYQEYIWNATNTTDLLTVNFNGLNSATRVGNCSQTSDMLTLELQYAGPFTSANTWNNYGTGSWRIERFDQFTATGMNSFTVLAYVDLTPLILDNFTEVIISGTTCIPLKGCESVSANNGNDGGGAGANATNGFNSACPSSELVNAVTFLMNDAVENNNFYGTHTISNSNFQNFPELEPIIDQMSSYPTTAIIWYYDGNSYFVCRDNTNNNVIEVLFTGTVSSDILSISNPNPITDFIAEVKVVQETGLTPVPSPPYPPYIEDVAVRFELFNVVAEEGLSKAIIVTNCCEEDGSGTVINTDGVSPLLPTQFINGDFESGNTNINSLYGLNLFCPSISEYAIRHVSDPNCVSPPIPIDYSNNVDDNYLLIHSKDELIPVKFWENYVLVTPYTYYEIDFSYQYPNAIGTINSLRDNKVSFLANGTDIGSLETHQELGSHYNYLWTLQKIYWYSGSNNLLNLEITSKTDPGVELWFAIDNISINLSNCNDCPVVEPVTRNCIECLPNTDAPVDCYTKYEEYKQYIVRNTPILPNDYNAGTPAVLDEEYFPYYYVSQEEFCTGSYKLNTDAYINYLNGLMNLGVINPFLSDINTNKYFVSLNNFILNDLALFVPHYLTYVSAIGINATTGFLSLADFATGEYSSICVQEFVAVNPLPKITQPIEEVCRDIFPQIRECTKFVVPQFPTPPVVPDPCETYKANLAAANGAAAYNTYITQVAEDFRERYINYAVTNVVENFTMTAPDQEYHYTLYNYDQGGNLISTVPPRGVHPLNLSTPASAQPIKDAREDKTNPVGLLPNHNYLTTYKYNTLNQLIEQTTPDGGKSEFWYDKLGRLVISKNAEQEGDDMITADDKYSYTRYDALGRIIEVGELASDVVPKHRFNNPTPTPADVNYDAPYFPYTELGNSTQFSWPGISAINEVTRTFYDEVTTNFAVPVPFSYMQENLRNRVVRTTYQESVGVFDLPINKTNYERATHYSYDIHGNVKELVQENKAFGLMNLGHQFKKMEYTYDLISGNVLQVTYQKGKEDAFYHKYEYDADNRITNVWTSQDEVIWTQDAKYFYYEHGPLARTEIGHDKVQGTDYAYTIQGWLKANNGTALKPTTEMGKDGHYSGSNLNQNIARDAYGFGLTYNANDYAARFTPADGFKNDLVTGNVPATTDLYNGNIAQMAVALSDENESSLALMANNYTYDQLNRIKSMRSHSGTESNYNVANTAPRAYNVDLMYDPNGNILKLDRNDDTGSSMDQLEYWYLDENNDEFNPQISNPANATNRLAYVKEIAGVTPLATDIEDQSTFNVGPNDYNYAYDEIGNLIEDKSEGITGIDWTVYGKIKAIHKTNGLNELAFEYDASGNRVTKIVKPGSIASDWEYIYYVRDASGNVMATYNYSPEKLSSPEKITLNEHHIYGSSRIAVVNEATELSANIAFLDVDLFMTGTDAWYPATSTSVINTGNNSIKITQSGIGGGALKSITTIPGNTYTINLDVTLGSTPAEITVFDSPSLVTNFGAIAINSNGQQTYTFTATSAMSYIKVHYTAALSDHFYINYAKIEETSVPTQFSFNKGKRNFELTNHLGNVMSVVTDKKIPNFSSGNLLFDADVISYSDYYPFGSLLPGRSGNSGDYRYGFNGYEKDDEIKGVTGSSYDFGARIYDPRLGRLLSVDPRKGEFPWASPYSFAANNPIKMIDVEGEGPDISICTVQKITRDGKTIIKIKLNLEIKVAVINQSSVVLNQQQMQIMAQDMDSKAKSLSKKNITGTLLNSSVNKVPIDYLNSITRSQGGAEGSEIEYEMSMSTSYLGFDNVEDVPEGYEIYVLADSHAPTKNQNVGGMANYTEGVATGNIGIKKGGDVYKRTEVYKKAIQIAIHEIGHQFGLGDEYEVVNFVQTNDGGDNLMGANYSFKLKQFQFDDIVWNAIIEIRNNTSVKGAEGKTYKLTNKRGGTYIPVYSGSPSDRVEKAVNDNGANTK